MDFWYCPAYPLSTIAVSHGDPMTGADKKDQGIMSASKKGGKKMKKQSIRARAISAALVISIIGLVVTIINLGITLYRVRYDTTSIDAGKTMQFTFTSRSPQSGYGTVSLSKGKMKYGWSQIAGDSTCRYTLQYKATTSSRYTTARSNSSFSKNGKYMGPYSMTNSNGRTKYNILLTKTAGKKKASKIRLDVLLC